MARGSYRKRDYEEFIDFRSRLPQISPVGWRSCVASNSVDVETATANGTGVSYDLYTEKSLRFLLRVSLGTVIFSMTIDLKMWRSSNESCVNAIYDERDERTFVFPVCVCCKKKISHREEDELKYEGKRGLEYHISPRKRITRNALNGNPEKRRRLCNWSKR